MAGVALLAAVALMVPATAGAQDSDCIGPTGDQYCPNTQILTGSGSDSSDPVDPADPGSSATLPFTGFDLALSLAAAAGLLGAGFVLRRASRSRGTA
jgi:hypothetical protein